VSKIYDLVINKYIHKFRVLKSDTAEGEQQHRKKTFESPDDFLTPGALECVHNEVTSVDILRLWWRRSRGLSRKLTL